MRTLALPKEVEHWSLTTLREKLVKIGAKVVSHGRYVTFQLAEVAVPRVAARVLAQHGRVAPVNIAQRVIYAETAATGQGVTETRNTKAAQELADLWTYLKGLS